MHESKSAVPFANSGITVWYDNGNNMLLGLADFSALIMGSVFFGVILVYSREIIALFLGASHAPVLAFAENGAKLYAFAFFANGLTAACEIEQFSARLSAMETI